jgi:hypothetical protein
MGFAKPLEGSRKLKDVPDIGTVFGMLCFIDIRWPTQVALSPYSEKGDQVWHAGTHHSLPGNDPTDICVHRKNGK